MTRIAIISQFYFPEPCAAANRIVAMAAAFAQAGHEVRVYTGMPSFPEGVVAGPYRGLKHLVEVDGRVTVERVWTYAAPPSIPGNRLFNWLSVAIGIARRIATASERYDAIIVSSPPITLALPALVAAVMHAAPLVVDVRDVFPDVAVKMGAWKAGSPVARAVGAVADALYRAASAITCVTETARAEIMARGVSAAKVELAPNGFDPVVAALDSPYPTLPHIRDVVYVGNMGLATGLDVIIGAAERFQTDGGVRFVLIGGGADAERLRARVANGKLQNVLFTGPLPRADALRALANATATVVPLVATIVDSVPTKLFDAMLVGTPVVVSAAGEARWLVERADVGLAATPGDPDALAAALRRLLDEPGLAARFRANGPPFVRAHYDRSEVMRKLVASVSRLSKR